MMRALLCSMAVFTVGFALGCSPWPAPGPGTRWPAPQGLGTFITQGAPLRDTILDLVAKGDRAYALQTLAPGYSVELEYVASPTTALFELDATSHAVRELPAAPIAVKALWPSDESQGVLAVNGSEVASFDGATWTSLPALPSSATLGFLYRADAQRVFARLGTSPLVYAAGAWRDLLGAVPARARQQLVFGPWSASAVRVVWTEPGATQLQACTQTIDTTTLSALDAASCKDNLPTGQFLGEAVNGTIDDFQVTFAISGGGGLVWRFANGAWSRGANIGASRARVTPGAKDLCLDAAVSGAPPGTSAVMRVSGGQPAETLFMPSYALFGCAGDERTCARNVDLTIQAVNRDCTATWLLSDNFVDATRKVYLKDVALPAHDAVACSPACSAQQLCAAVSDSAGACVADPASNATASLFAASLRLQVGVFSGVRALPELSFANPETGAPLAGFSTQLDQEQRTVASGPAQVPVTMTVHVSGSVDRAFTFTMPNENTQADLGTVFLFRGTRLGKAPAALNAGALSTVLVSDAGGSLVLPLQGADGGVTVTQVEDDGAGGVQARALAPSDGSASTPVASPDGRWLLWRDGRGLEVLELATAQRTTVASAAVGPWLTASAVFSGDSSTVAIPRGSPEGSTSVVSLGALPTERFVASAPGQVALQLSHDGATLLRHLATGWELATSTSAFVASTAAHAWLSGDGSRLYSASGDVGALALSVQATTEGGPSVQVATGVRAVTVDPLGADALFSTFLGGKTTVSRVAGATGQVSVVQASIAGVADARPSGALWVRDASATTVFFPFGQSPGRVFSGAHSFVFDDRRQLLAVATGLLLTHDTATTLPPGPGVFTAGATRRISAATASISTLSGNSEVSVKRYASPNLSPPPVVDARFTNPATDGRQSYGAPCAVYSVPVAIPSVTSGGAVSWTADGSEVYCVR